MGYLSYWEEIRTKLKPKDHMQTVIVIDIDKTLADNSHRCVAAGVVPTDEEWEKHLNPELVMLDTPYPEAQRVMKKLLARKDIKIILATGRDERYRNITTGWMMMHYNLKVDRHNLLMRETGDHRPPTKVKGDMVEKIARLNHNSSFVFIDDDRYIWKVYAKFGLTLTAPDCWKVLEPDNNDESTEIARRW